MVGPGVRKTLQGYKGGKVRKLACPAHMGVWPEREAPAVRFTSVHLAVEKGEGFVLPLFFSVGFVSVESKMLTAGSAYPKTWFAGCRFGTSLPTLYGFIRHLFKDVCDHLQTFHKFF